MRWLSFICLFVTVKSRFSCVFVCTWSEGCFEVCLQEWKVESYSPGSRCKQDDWNSPSTGARCRCRYCTLRYRYDLDVTSFGHGPCFSDQPINQPTDGRTDRPTDRPTNQPTSQPTNQPTNRSDTIDMFHDMFVYFSPNLDGYNRTGHQK